VERRALFATSDTLVLNLSNTAARNYQFELMAGNAGPLITATLEDAYTRLSTPVNMQGLTRVSFSINADKASAAANRFRIVLKRVANSLATHFIDINAAKLAHAIVVNWQVENEPGTQYYELQKSLDGLHFSTLRQVNATDVLRYSEADTNPTPGNNFYRVKSVDQNGEAVYSNTVAVSWKADEKRITVYPNPIKNGIIHLYLFNQPAGTYQVKMFSELGQLLREKPITYNGLPASMSIALPGVKAASGTYLLQVFTPDRQVEILRINVQ
jgi:hypothetical protein